MDPRRWLIKVRTTGWLKLKGANIREGALPRWHGSLPYVQYLFLYKQALCLEDLSELAELNCGPTRVIGLDQLTLGVVAGLR
jgi:hypothetical protein